MFNWNYCRNKLNSTADFKVYSFNHITKHLTWYCYLTLQRKQDFKMLSTPFFSWKIRRTWSWAKERVQCPPSKTHRGKNQNHSEFYLPGDDMLFILWAFHCERWFCMCKAVFYSSYENNTVDVHGILFKQAALISNWLCFLPLFWLSDDPQLHGALGTDQIPATNGGDDRRWNFGQK